MGRAASARMSNSNAGPPSVLSARRCLCITSSILPAYRRISRIRLLNIDVSVIMSRHTITSIAIDIMTIIYRLTAVWPLSPDCGARQIMYQSFMPSSM